VKMSNFFMQQIQSYTRIKIKNVPNKNTQLELLTTNSNRIITKRRRPNLPHFGSKVFNCNFNGTLKNYHCNFLFFCKILDLRETLRLYAGMSWKLQELGRWFWTLRCCVVRLDNKEHPELKRILSIKKKSREKKSLLY
jgi:hypothetical protein